MNGLIAATLPKATHCTLSTRTTYPQVRYSNTQTLLEAKEHNGKPLRPSRVPRGYWSNHDVQRDALERYGRERLGVRELDDWYNVSVLDVRNELSFISNYHKDSLFIALKTLYPTHSWDPLKFKSVPRGYWSDENAQRDALERFGRERLGVKELDDWYKVVATDVTTELSFLSHQYNCSLQAALKKLYPHHNWNDLKFSSAPQGFWKKLSTKQSMKNVLSNIIQRYNIKHLNDWYDIPKEDWKTFTKISTSLFGGKEKLLRTWFPHHKWADDLSSSAPERQLRELMQQIRSNITAHPKIYGHSIDIYLPNLSLAVEYQGQQHYEQLRFGSFKGTISRDSRKRMELQQKGIQLVSIPYWWKGSWAQLEATLHKHMALVANHS